MTRSRAYPPAQYPPAQARLRSVLPPLTWEATHRHARHTLGLAAVHLVSDFSPRSLTQTLPRRASTAPPSVKRTPDMRLGGVHSSQQGARDVDYRRGECGASMEP
jgi:hypothetical protein